MKKGLFIMVALFLLSAFSSYAQENMTGTIVYEELAKIDIKLEGEMAHLMKDMPTERRVEKNLHFNSEASLYTDKPVDHNAPDIHAASGIRIMMGTPNNKLFIDLEKKEIIEQRDFMTRMFLIEAEMPEEEWKVSGEQKMILDYPCMQATKADTAGVVTKVWFAPGITVQSGPARYCNLPGMVLEVDVNDGEQKILAKSISFEEPGKDLLKKPKDGKKVTNKEFEKIVEEKIKEMGAEAGSGAGTIMIKIKH